MSCHKHIEFPIIGLASKNIVVLITRHANNYGSNYFTEKAFYCCKCCSSFIMKSMLCRDIIYFIVIIFKSCKFIAVLLIHIEQFECRPGVFDTTLCNQD